MKLGLTESCDRYNIPGNGRTGDTISLVDSEESEQT